MARSRQKKQESEDEEYVVEKIRAHKRTKAGLQYKVKWQDYNKPEDDTWEPESALEGAPERVEKYWKSKNPEDQLDRYKVGSKEYKNLQAKIAKEAEENDEEDSQQEDNSSPRAKRAASKRVKEKSRSTSPRKKRSSNSRGGDDEEKSKPSKRVKRSEKTKEEEEEEEEEEEVVEDQDEEEDEEEADGHQPGERAELEWEEITQSTKGGSWEDLVEKIETCIAGPSEIEGRPLMLCVWKQKTKEGLACASFVDSKICRETCPQKCLDFYETHLKFNTHTDGQGESTVEEQDEDSEREEDEDDEVSQQESEEVEQPSTTKTTVSPAKSTTLNGSSKTTNLDTAE
ncbi:hypothetical protein JCM5350_002932 [Sporobolomyces pararoseus]